MAKSPISPMWEVKIYSYDKPKPVYITTENAHEYTGHILFNSFGKAKQYMIQEQRKELEQLQQKVKNKKEYLSYLYKIRMRDE